MEGSPSPSSTGSSPAAGGGGGGRKLQFVLLQSRVDEGFCRGLAHLKLNTLRTDDSPIPITGYYAPCSHPRISTPLALLAESLPRDESGQSPGITRVDRNKCPVPGTLLNTNNLRSFETIDGTALLKAEAKKILEDIVSGKVEQDPAVLLRFLVISFADLKNWGFHYCFAFPALVLDSPSTLLRLQPALKALSREEATSLSRSCNEWRNSSTTADVPFFLVSITSDSRATIRQLKDLEACRGDGEKLLFGFYDHCNHPSNPGWPLRNYIAYICLRWKIQNIHFFCYREKRGLADLELSLIGEAFVPGPHGLDNPDYAHGAVGWEEEKPGKKPKGRFINLRESMDPERQIIAAQDLHLKLMGWRHFPVNLEKLSSVRCLLLGVGTLGCDVALLLMGWGIRKLTLVDSGHVAMSNLVRQSLYTLQDCGDPKATAIVRNLKSRCPAVEAEGIQMSIPMPGHPISENEAAGVLEDCWRLQSLVASHDAVFLLTDTRESRWLPTLLCANENKIAITAALGYDSYLVMRHGAGPGTRSDGIDAVAAEMKRLSTEDVHGRQRLGCYFCNDVVAPVDSVSNRTLDQQCTVTRPGLAPVASGHAVELFASMLHHPDGIHAPGEIAGSSSEHPLGILPHQIRGSVSQCTLLTLLGYASSNCTACSNAVLSEYRRGGMDFVMQAINDPTYLEHLTGLTDLMNSVAASQMEWIDDGDDDFAEI